MNTKVRRTIITAVAVFVGAAVLLSGGAGMTAFAAQSALPGDVLYPVKTTLEQTRITMAQGAAARAELNLAYAERRLGEIASLIAEGRFQNVSTATRDFEAFIGQALSEVDAVSQGDAERAAQLNARVAETLSIYGRTLSSMLESVPDPVRSEIRRAIDDSQLGSTPAVVGTESEFTGTVEAISPGAWIIGGKTVFIHSQTERKGAIQLGDAVKVHASLNGDGDLVAREVELFNTGTIPTTGDGNGNDNTNGSINGNTNGNTNGFADGNANSNENGNLNANLNQNSNVNGIDDHGGTNGNTNDSGNNSNTNDDSSNINTNTDPGNGNGGFDDHGGNSGGGNSGSGGGGGGGGSGSGNGNDNGDDY
jgi:uncharacterized membrane protein YgcG